MALKRISYSRARPGIDEMPSTGDAEEHPWIGDASALLELRKAIAAAVDLLFDKGETEASDRLQNAVTACVKRGMLGER